MFKVMNKAQATKWLNKNALLDEDTSNKFVENANTQIEYMNLFDVTEICHKLKFNILTTVRVTHEITKLQQSLKPTMLKYLIKYCSDDDSDSTYHTEQSADSQHTAKATDNEDPSLGWKVRPPFNDKKYSWTKLKFKQ